METISDSNHRIEVTDPYDAAVGTLRFKDVVTRHSLTAAQLSIGSDVN